MYAPVGNQGILHLGLKHPIVAVVAIAVLIGMSGGYFTDDGDFVDIEDIGMVSITFDDGYSSVLENAFPIMEKYGYKGTAYIVPAFVKRAGYMSWEEISVLVDNGWEIGSHTMGHFDLTEISKERVHYELFMSKYVLESRLGVEVNSFASPYGYYNEEVVKMISNHYQNHRTAWPDGLNDLPLGENERYLLKGVAGDTNSPEEVKRWIDRAKEEGKYLILIFHRIGEEGEYNTSVDDFENIIEHLHKENFVQFETTL